MGLHAAISLPPHRRLAAVTSAVGSHRAERALKLRGARMAAALDLAPARLNAVDDMIDHGRCCFRNVREKLGVFGFEIFSSLAREMPSPRAIWCS